MFALCQGIFHAGAVLDSGVISNITAARVRGEYSGKAFGAWNLIKDSTPSPIRTVKLFSSLAAFSGSGGQGSYASANAVLDSWAQTLQVNLSYVHTYASVTNYIGVPDCCHDVLFK